MKKGIINISNDKIINLFNILNQHKKEFNKIVEITDASLLSEKLKNFKFSPKC